MYLKNLCILGNLIRASSCMYCIVLIASEVASTVFKGKLFHNLMTNGKKECR